MMKSFVPRPWVCSRCTRQASWLRLEPRRRRWLSADAAATAHSASTIPICHSTSDALRDDTILRRIFDSPSAWKDFSRAAKSSAGSRRVGLFRNAYLTRPEGFLAFAHTSLARAQKIVDKVLSASSQQEYKDIVRDLDRLSDLLCRVIDLSDFVRVTHPDARTQRAASEAWSLVYQYMNQLNTTTGLNDQLAKAMRDPAITAAWSEEEKTVAQMLYLDFTKSAISLPQESRDRFVALSQQIGEVGSRFVNEMAPEQQQLVLPSSRFQGMNPVLARRLTIRGNMYLPTTGPEPALALRSVHDEETRKALYYATRTASQRSVYTLEAMLKLRAELANLAGFESHGHMTLRDRMMAKSPESVRRFLLELAKNNAPIVQQEMSDLVREKQAHLNSTSPDFYPWDKDYYSARIRQALSSQVKHDDFLSAYFSLGTIMQGLSRLFSRLYGIRLVPRETLPGETWHPDVRRLDVISDTDGHVAVLYCDLFYRDDKSPNPAHFTVRCSREISQEELAGAPLQPEGPSGTTIFESPVEAANDGMSVSHRDGVLKQLPTIALVCDFPQRAGSGDKPAFLAFFQMETLFHEMGHAIHSILARTSLQNVAGTRCATDLAELPSTLMEHFAADPSVLALFARHHETDDPLPYGLVAEKLREARRFEGLDTENQIVLAMLDQEYHSPLVLAPGFDSTDVYHGLQRALAHGPADPAGTRWQGFFGHLFGYGSTYYSYLFDRVLAERVWKVVFSAGRDGQALSRENGERLKENLLKWGGGRDPWRCLSDTLRDDRLASGDEKAMALVGSWGTSSTFKGQATD